MPLREGDPARVGRYRLTARLGAGGMGVVYLGSAKDGTQAAVKVLRPELADDQEFRVRFRREVAVMARVAGLCTVKVIEADTESAMPFLATEYADGPSLAEYVSGNGPLGPDMLLGLAAGLAEALTAIHAAGVIHRDLKPGNVLLTTAGPKVIDFGIAQALDATSLTKTGMTVGSPGFMAPEQVLGQAGQAADVFAWGLTVAYAAGGQSPFGTGPTDAILYRIMHTAPDLSFVPERLRPLVEVALAKNPADRPTALDLVARVTSASSQASDPVDITTHALLARTWPLPAHDVPHPRIPTSGRRRYPLVLLAVAVIAVALGTGAALLSSKPHQPSSAASGTNRTATARPSATADSASPPAHGVATVTVAASPSAARDVSGTADAADRAVAALGYGAPGQNNPAWDPSAPLNVVVAYTTGSADGGGNAFFFANGKYIGTDAPDTSTGVGALRVTPNEIDVTYALYNPGDPRCCASGGTDSVRFYWNGTRLVALDPVPSTARRN